MHLHAQHVIGGQFYTAATSWVFHFMQGNCYSTATPSNQVSFIFTPKRIWACAIFLAQAKQQRLDRLQFYPTIRGAIPDLLLDILNKNPDDLAFQDLVDAATIRAISACIAW